MKNSDSHDAFDSHPAFEADLKAFLDGELPFLRRFQLRRHLQNCAQCREEIQIMQTIETELKTEENAPLEADLRAKILGNLPVETPKVKLRSQIRLVPALGLGAAFLAIFASVLFPVFSRSRENARRSASQSDLKQIGLGISQYSQDYDERFAAAPPNAAPMAGAASVDKKMRGNNGVSSELGAKNESGASFRRNSGESYEFAPPQRAVHKQGSISVAVDDAEAKGSAVEITVKNVGGFVAQNALSTGGDGRKTATLDVRVPVADFENVVAKIGKLGIVREKSVNGEDITQRVTRAAAQQKSLQNELSIRQAQLRAANPKKVDARRNIVADVRQLRFQANQARAQLEYLRKYAALSTLFVTLQDKPKTAAPAGWTGDFGQTGRQAWSSFLQTAKLPIAVLIWILAYAPLWLPALLIWRKLGRKWFAAT